MDFNQAADVVGTGFQVVGIAVLVVGSLLAFVMYLRALPRRRDMPAAYSDLRRDLGKTILVGLELLVAADIISSVAINPTFATIGVLGLIVLIRTFLSWSLEVEVSGRWPWQSSRAPNEDSSCG
jgi:uncharacterized membrane protein